MLQGTIGSKIMAGALCILLTACGGGGGSSGTASPQAGTVGAAGATPATGTTGTAGTANPTGNSTTTGTAGSDSQVGASPSPTGTGGTTGTTGTTGSTTPQTETRSTTPSGQPVSAAQQTPSSPAADATRARFNGPLGIAVDINGNLLVADALNHTVRRISRTGVVTTLAGSPGTTGSTDGTGAAARFSALKGIAVDGAGNAYAVDNGAIRKITPSGVVTTLAGAVGQAGDADGPGATARFRQPWGIASDTAGNLYVADTGNYLVRRITPSGEVGTHAGTRGMRGTANGSAGTATFLGPMGVALDSAGNLYLTDWYGPPAANIPEGSTFIRKIAADGSTSTVAGNYRGETGPAAFSDTFALTADTAGNIYVAAQGSVRKVTSTGTVSAVAGPGAEFQVLNGIAVDNSGNLYVTDESNSTVSRVTQSGEVTLLAGKPGENGSVDEPATQ